MELLACFDTGQDLQNVRGIAFLKDGRLIQTPPREPITAFEQLPLPDFSVLRHARMKIYPVSGTRGCGMDCEFCAVKGKPRFASPERLMEQFASAYEKWGGKMFFIVDDLFGQNRGEALSFCRMLRDYQDRLGVRFHIMVQIRLDRARDTELLQAMREAGINNLAIGFESPIAEELKAMSKRLNPQQMIDLARSVSSGRIPNTRHVHLRLPRPRGPAVPDERPATVYAISAGSFARPAWTPFRSCCPYPFPEPN